MLISIILRRYAVDSRSLRLMTMNSSFFQSRHHDAPGDSVTVELIGGGQLHTHVILIAARPPSSDGLTKKRR